MSINLKKTATYAGIAFVLVVVVGAVWKEFFHYQVFPKRFGVVEAGEIYRSGQIHPALIGKVLAENGIKVVIDLQYWEEKPAIVAEKSTVQQLGLTQYRFPLLGNGTGDIENYVAAIKQIHDSVAAGDPVLVHCSAGTQRTGGVIAAYRTLVQGRSAESAVAEMTQYDWDPEDDQAVLVYLDENIETLAKRLVEENVIPGVPAVLPHFAGLTGATGP